MLKRGGVGALIIEGDLGSRIAFLTRRKATVAKALSEWMTVSTSFLLLTDPKTSVHGWKNAQDNLRFEHGTI